MTSSEVEVPGEQLLEYLRRPPEPLRHVRVLDSPPDWGRCKPALVRFAREARAAGRQPPQFSGVPLCLFGSEWPGFPSASRRTPPLGRCAGCGARHACAFVPAVPEELLPLSDAPLIDRWHEYGVAFAALTGNAGAESCRAILERLFSVYGGPVSLEPSILLRDGVEPALRFVVFPHHSGGPDAEARYRRVLACAESMLDELECRGEGSLFAELGRIAPVPVPLGLDGQPGAWRLKMYLRVEDRSPAAKDEIVAALTRRVSGLCVPEGGALAMLGLVFDCNGLLTVKAYVAARPAHPPGDAFPERLDDRHPLVVLSGDRALATIDVWTRGGARADKWDFNVREHYLAGTAAHDLIGRLVSREVADRLGPLLVASSYRADVVAVGVRGRTIALYTELN